MQIGFQSKCSNISAEGLHFSAFHYVLNAYLYCVNALVGGAISIRDPYICAVHGSVPTNRTLSSTGPLYVQLKRNYRLHASIKVYFVGKKL